MFSLSLKQSHPDLQKNPTEVKYFKARKLRGSTNTNILQIIDGGSRKTILELKNTKVIRDKELTDRNMKRRAYGSKKTQTNGGANRETPY